MRNRIWLVLVVLMALAGVGALGWWVYDRSRGDAVPPGFVAASGRLEIARQSDIKT